MTSWRNDHQIRQNHGFPENHNLGIPDYYCSGLHHPLSICTCSQNPPSLDGDSQKNVHSTQIPASPLLAYDPCMASHQSYDLVNEYVNSNMSRPFGYPELFSYDGPKNFIEDQYIFPGELFSAPFQEAEDYKVSCNLYSSSQSSVSSGKEQQSSYFPKGCDYLEGAQSSRTRIKWTEELNRKFIDCVNILGGAEKATPKAVLNLMGSEVLTISHVKSHLQKYRAGKYTPVSVQEESNKRMSIHEMHQLYMKTSLQIKEALQMQLECEKHLRQQLEIQQNMQLMIEEKMEQLRNMIKLRADKGLHDVKNSNSNTTQNEPSESTTDQVLTSKEENIAEFPNKIC